MNPFLNRAQKLVAVEEDHDTLTLHTVMSRYNNRLHLST